MSERKYAPAPSTHDAVMSWLQNLEMKDHKLGDARSGKGGKAIIAAVIGRMQEKAYKAFPAIDHATLDSLVQQYVDPQGQLRGTQET